ncbi:hypothetical protein EPO15_11065 [bacterium]|nr:MAG: hypothetical protein EPO15_11065 [bacterium]
MTALLVAAAGVGAAAALYWGLMRFGGPDLRGWAVPGSAALACAALGLAFRLPSWLTIGLFFGALFVLNRKARQRLAAEAEAVKTLALPELGWEFAPFPVPEGGPVAAWSCRDAVDADPVVLSLDYQGEKEEDSLTTVTTRAARFKPGLLVAHRPGAGAAAAGQAGERDPVEGLEGQPPGVVLRCMPGDYAFAFCDLRTLSVLADALELARADREVYVHVNGPEVKVACQGLPGREDIKRLLVCAAVLAARQRHLGRQEGA